MKNIKISSLAVALVASLSSVHAQFTPGNLVVLQEGNGISALSSAAAPIILNQYTTSGAFVNNLALPSTGPTALVNSGSASSEGALTLSANGQYLVLAGYNAAAGMLAIAGTTAAAVPRGVATVDASGNYSLAATTSTAFSGNNIRSGVSDGANNFWGAGAGSGSLTGINYFGTASSAASVMNVNSRIANLFNNSLYYSTSSGTRGIYTFSSAPTTATTATLLFATGAASSPYDFAFNANQTLAYVADDSANATGGIQRWDFNGTSWALTYTLGTGASNIGARGLAVDFSGASPVIYATTAEGSADRLITITDTGAGSTPTTLATAGLNTIFRGLDFAPTPAPEPSTLALTGLGLFGLLSLRRLNDRKA